jgi:hypothetical protein
MGCHSNRVQGMVVAAEVHLKSARRQHQQQHQRQQQQALLMASSLDGSSEMGRAARAIAGQNTAAATQFGCAMFSGSNLRVNIMAVR